MDTSSDERWRDDEHFPMHRSHPGWNQRSAALTRWRLVVTVLFAVLVAATGAVMAWQLLR